MYLFHLPRNGGLKAVFFLIPTRGRHQQFHKETQFLNLRRTTLFELFRYHDYQDEQSILIYAQDIKPA